MSGFTESGFIRKLADLSSSQQSIQSLSQWLIHHRKHHQVIVKLWYKEFIKAQEHRKLTFLYLANDVIQNSRKKGTDFTKTFAPCFKKVLEQMAKITGEKIKKSVLRILSIWEERQIYDEKLIKEFTSLYEKAWLDLHDEEFDFESDAISQMLSKAGSQSSTSGDNDKSEGESDSGKRKSSLSRESLYEKPGSSSSSSSEHRAKRIRTKKEEIDAALRKRSMEKTNTVDEIEADGVVQMEVKLSPSPYKDPPTEEELIQLIKDLENMPSTDAVIRGNIANLPPEVSDVAKIDEICIDSDVARSVHEQIVSAMDLVQNYNTKLDAELDTRKVASMKLQDFVHLHSDLLGQAENRLEEHQAHLKVMYKKIEALKAHVSSMPDFTKLPAVTDGLAPLPSASLLFQ